MPDLAIRVNLAREMGWLEEFGWDGRVIVPAHILAGLKKRAASMIGRLGCPYVIDPYTYVFGADTREIADKRWFPRLMADYGIDTVTHPDSPRLDPAALVKGGAPTDSLRELVHNVVEHQKSAVASAASEADPYAAFESDSGKGRAPAGGPEWIIPPYFLVDSAGSDWLGVNIESAEISAELAQDAGSVHAMAMVDRDLLADRQAVREVASAYRALPVAGYMVWPAYLDENRATRAELASLKRFVAELSRDGRPVHAAYGGLFSLLAGPATGGGGGASHAICYGEHRSPFEAAGGGFSVRFYLPGICSKVPYARRDEIREALGLAECGCRYCKIQAGESPMPALEHAALHFLEQRSAELGQIGRHGGKKFIERLALAYSDASGRDRTGEYARFYGHLEAWQSALSGGAPGDPG